MENKKIDITLQHILNILIIHYNAAIVAANATYVCYRMQAVPSIDAYVSCLRTRAGVSTTCVFKNTLYDIL